MSVHQPVLVVAPHPDDETLGCGGTLLRHVAAGHAVYWLIVTTMRTEDGFSEAAIGRRQLEVEKVAAAYRFMKVYFLGLPSARLDTLPIGDLVPAIGRVIKATEPSIIYLPFPGDAHSDHAAVFKAATACTKWFRYPSIRRVLCYETPSETDFGLDPQAATFTPNSFVDITPYVDQKIEIMKMYAGEMGEFPFPRSAEALRSFARVRGAACGCQAAESFMLLREIVDD